MAPSVLLSYQYLPWKPTSSADLSTTEKIKTLVQDHIGSAVRALTKAKSMVMELVRWKSEEQGNLMKKPRMLMKKSKKKKKRRTSLSMRCSNWYSSHILPILPDQQTCTEEIEANQHGWSSMVSDGCGHDQLEPQFSGYLHWLEENKMPEDGMAVNYVDEIDRLAEMFIARCHEKFRLEKQESLRMYQEMLARSM